MLGDIVVLLCVGELAALFTLLVVSYWFLAIYFVTLIVLLLQMSVQKIKALIHARVRKWFYKGSLLN